MSGVPEGKKFSLHYMDRGALRADSSRFRLRIARAFDVVHVDNVIFGTVIEAEVGAEVPRLGYGYHYTLFFKEGALHDVLDTITVIFVALRNNGYEGRAHQWRDQLRRIIAEENLGYRLDDHGGVHLGVDDEFEHNRAATVKGLGGSRYEAARTAFDGAHNSLDQTPPDGRAAIRLTFDALEIVFRLALGAKVTRLGAAEIEKHLKPMALARHSGQAHDALNLLLNSFADWVNAAHNYRHSTGVENHEAAPLDLAILLVSSGSCFLRWLVELDQDVTQK
jgi:hypothetical protein